MPRPTLQGDAERLAETHEVVVLVIDADETAADLADTAAEADLIPVLLFDFQIDVDVRFDRIRFELDVFRTNRLEISELIQPLHARVPQRCVENLSFIDHDLAADHLIARCRVAVEGDPIDGELPVFFDADVQIDQPVGFIEALRRHRREIDVALRSVLPLQILETFAKPCFVVDLTGHHSQRLLDGVLTELSGARHANVADAILVVFVDLDRDVIAVERLFPERNRNAPGKWRPDQRQRPHQTARLRLDDRLRNAHAREPVLAIQHADPSDIVGKFQVEVRVFAGENGQRAGFLHRLHRVLDLRRRQRFVSLKRDFLNSDLRPFIDFECDADRSRRNVFRRHGNGRVLAAFFGQHRFDHSRGFPDLDRIIRRFLSQTRFRFPESFSDIGTGDGFDAVVFNGPDQPLFLHDKSHNLTRRAGFLLHPYVIEVPQGIQRLHVAPDDVLTQLAASLGLKVVLDCIRRNPAIAANADLFDAIRVGSLQRLWAGAGQDNSQQHCKNRHPVLRRFYYKWNDLDWLWRDLVNSGTDV